jgi:hypothetical protein
MQKETKDNKLKKLQSSESVVHFDNASLSSRGND